MKITSEKILKEYIQTQLEKYPWDGIIKMVFVNTCTQRKYYIVDEGDDLLFPDTLCYVYDDLYAHYDWAGNGYKCNMQHINDFMTRNMEIEENNPYIGKSLYYMYNCFEINHYRQEIELYERKIRRLEELNRAYELQQTFE